MQESSSQYFVPFRKCTCSLDAFTHCKLLVTSNGSGKLWTQTTEQPSCAPGAIVTARMQTVTMQERQQTSLLLYAIFFLMDSTILSPQRYAEISTLGKGRSRRQRTALCHLAAAPASIWSVHRSTVCNSRYSYVHLPILNFTLLQSITTNLRIYSPILLEMATIQQSIKKLYSFNYSKTWYWCSSLLLQLLSNTTRTCPFVIHHYYKFSIHSLIRKLTTKIMLPWATMRTSASCQQH